MGDSDDSKKEKKLGFIRKSNDDFSDSGQSYYSDLSHSIKSKISSSYIDMEVL